MGSYDEPATFGKSWTDFMDPTYQLAEVGHSTTFILTRAKAVVLIDVVKQTVNILPSWFL